MGCRPGLSCLTAPSCTMSRVGRLWGPSFMMLPKTREGSSLLPMDCACYEQNRFGLAVRSALQGHIF